MAAKDETLNRAAEVDDLLEAVRGLIVPFISAADTAAADRAAGGIPPGAKNVLIDLVPPEELVKALDLQLPETGAGKQGVLDLVRHVLAYSVNTWDQGFLDKLYASNNAVGVVADLVLSVLNTNLHVYQVSPALTVIEKATARALARMFGFTGPRAGGVTCQGGSSSNLSSLVLARNTLYPATKAGGNAAHDFVVFTSAHGHYSVAKAALTCGIGSANVWTVPVDAQGRMRADKLAELVVRAKAQGRVPFYVNATAGTTVMGSFDDIHAIANVADAHGLWLHVDASWGGGAVFSATQRAKLAGSGRARSLTMNPHKMLGVPVTCSFLLTNDVGEFRRANSLPAGYLFHGSAQDGDGQGEEPEVWDLADLTLQCGRRGDAFKMALAWVAEGSAGFAAKVDAAFAAAAALAQRIHDDGDFVLVSEMPPPCLQVCFYYAPGGRVSADEAVNSRRTRVITQRLIRRGFMVDYAPGPSGSFFRVVVNVQTLMGTVDGLVAAFKAVGPEVVREEEE